MSFFLNFVSVISTGCRSTFGLFRLFARLSILCLSLFCIHFSDWILFTATTVAIQFSGIVVDPQCHPINKAIVRLQGSSVSALTDQKGHFKINVDNDDISKNITAWKDGYYNGGQPVSGEGKEYSIVLNPIQKGDNEKYVWIPSLNETAVADKAENKPCQQCHAELTEQWRSSTHGSSALNPVFLAFFSGADSNGKNGSGLGYKVDFPNSNGNCTTCHVPAMAMSNPFNSDPRQACGVEKEGVFCDLCHKIDDARIDNTGGYPGTLSLRFNRPGGKHQLFYGQYDDVFPGDDSYHPLYKDSRYCAPCHHGKFWNVLMYSEFVEWAESSYAGMNIHCQDCHMPVDGIMTRFAPEKEGGVERRQETILSHIFNGVEDRSLMTEGIDLDVLVELKENVLVVVAMVKNVKAGHHYPTGNPMRNMILLVDVSTENGLELPMISGDRVPVWGGIGPVEKGNYAGLPGKGFAKVLKDFNSYTDGRGQRHFQPEYPAPHWRPVFIESDNRIPANSTDISRYGFGIPADLCGSIRVEARLIFRKSYKKWMDDKGFEINDFELARKSLTVVR
jgi:hypothetical protein